MVLRKSDFNSAEMRFLGGVLVFVKYTVLGSQHAMGGHHSF